MATKKKKILLIAGHGKNHDGSYDPGACSKWGQEATYTRQWVKKLKTALGKKVSVTLYDVNKNCYSESCAGNVPDYAKYDFVYEAHLNAKVKKDENGDGSFTGTGGYKHPSNGCTPIAQKIVDNLVGIGFKKWTIADSTGLLNLNRCQTAGVLYFLHEIAFIDDGDDMGFFTAHENEMVQATAQAILEVLTGTGESVPAVAKDKKGTYLIKTTCDWLNIRKGPGKGYEITGSIREPKGAKKCYTITEERNGWGRLKSGAGWICLGYTVRQ